MRFLPCCLSRRRRHPGTAGKQARSAHFIIANGRKRKRDLSTFFHSLLLLFLVYTNTHWVSYSLIHYSLFMHAYKRPLQSYAHIVLLRWGIIHTFISLISPWLVVTRNNKMTSLVWPFQAASSFVSKVFEGKKIKREG